MPKHYFCHTIILSDTSIQTQCNIDYDYSAGAHYLESSGLDQSNKNHGNTDVNNIDDSR